MIDIEFVITNYLNRRIKEFGVPLPGFNNEEYWHKDFGSSYYLTDRGKHEANRRIRQELKERRDPIIQILAILIGVIGALTGLISVLR